MFACLSVEYALMLSKIQDQKIPEPSKVPEKFINVIGYAPKCYTDYEPHYNPKYELSQVVVGSDTHGWQRNNGLAFTPKGLDARWGYQDNRPYYTVIDRVYRNAHIHCGTDSLVYCIVS